MANAPTPWLFSVWKCSAGFKLEAHIYKWTMTGGQPYFRKLNHSLINFLIHRRSRFKIRYHHTMYPSLPQIHPLPKLASHQPAVERTSHCTGSKCHGIACSPGKMTELILSFRPWKTQNLQKCWGPRKVLLKSLSHSYWKWPSRNSEFSHSKHGDFQ